MTDLDQGTHVGVLGQTVQLGLVERTTRSEHVATTKDQEDSRKYGRTLGPKWEYRPRGLLEVRLKETAGRGAACRSSLGSRSTVGSDGRARMRIRLIPSSRSKPSRLVSGGA